MLDVGSSHALESSAGLDTGSCCRCALALQQRWIRPTHLHSLSHGQNVSNAKLIQNNVLTPYSEEDFDVRYHLGGYSPWIQKKTGVLQGDTRLPEECVVDQVHMMSRHAERYPTMLPGIRK